MDTRLMGKIESKTLPELLLKFHEDEKSGRLALTRADLRKNLYIRKGAVVFAASTERDDRLLQSLLRRGTVSLKHLLQGLEISLRTCRRLGEVLVEGKHLSKDDLKGIVRGQIKDIACSTFQWTDGKWEFEEGVDQGSEDITLDCHPLELILEGIRRTDSWARVQDVVGGLNTEFRATKRAAEVCEVAHLLPAERQIVDFCEETRSLEEICERISLNDYVVCKFLWGLLAVGAVMIA